MYKIGEVAEKLDIERKVIIQYLIEKSEELESHVYKEKGITYIDEKGLQKMSQFLRNTDVDSVEIGFVNKTKHDLSFENVSPTWSFNSQPIQVSTYERPLDDAVDVSPKIAFEINTEIWDKKIAEVKLKLVKLDAEIQRKNSEIIAYHDLLLDDLEWSWDLHEKITQFDSEKAVHIEKELEPSTSNQFINKLLKRFRR